MQRKKCSFTFTIEVKKNGSFRYSGTGTDASGKSLGKRENWSYYSGNKIRFRCKQGPFVIRYISFDHSTGDPATGVPLGPVPDTISPFGFETKTDPYTGVKAKIPVLFLDSGDTRKGGYYATEDKTIGQGVTKEELEAARKKHNNLFAAHFRYLVYVKTKKGANVDIGKNGMWWC
jgi:hypothetical protein